MTNAVPKGDDSCSAQTDGETTGLTWGRGRGLQMPLQYFFYLGAVHFVTELEKANKYKTEIFSKGLFG